MWSVSEHYYKVLAGSMSETEFPSVWVREILTVLLEEKKWARKSEQRILKSNINSDL